MTLEFASLLWLWLPSPDAAAAAAAVPDAQPAPVIVAPTLVEFEEAERPSPGPAVTVGLRLEIDAEGEVRDIELLESGGATFDASAIAAAKRFVFTPATEDGVPFVSQIEYRYRFEATEVTEEAAEPIPEDLPGDDVEVDDVEDVFAPRVVEDAAQARLSAEDADVIAGAQGDALKAATVLGGVGRPAPGADALIVWGASPSDTRRYVDWMPVPRLFHLGGSRSVVPSAMLDGVELSPGGFGVRHGRAIGGLLRARTRVARAPDAPRRAGGYARVDPIDVGIGADARLGRRRRTWVGVAARRSILAQTYGAVAPADAKLIVPLPDTWDAQAKLVYEPNRHDTIEVLGLTALDELQRGIPSRLPDRTFTETRSVAFHRLGVAYRRHRGDGSSFELATWGGWDADKLAQDFAVVEAGRAHEAARGGLRLSERRRLRSFLVLDAGIDAEVDTHAVSQRGAVTLPAREGDIVTFGQAPGDRVGSDAWKVTRANVGVFGSLGFEFAQRRWILEPGVRLAPLVTSGDRILPANQIDPPVGHSNVELGVEPRLALHWHPTAEIHAYASGGRYHQMASPLDRSPVFGRPELPSAIAYHAVTGLDTSPTSWLNLGATGFLILSDRIAVRSTDPTPATAEALEPTGQGRNFGGQLVGRATPGRGVDAHLAYTLSWAQRRQAADAQWRRFDFDQRHVLQAVLGWRHSTGVELGSRVSVSSGNPRTPVVGAVASGRDGTFDPIFGRQNAERLPTFFELSVRVGWSRSWDWGQLRAWLDVQNATHHANASEFIYSADYASRSTVRGLPILPLLGLQVRL